MRIISSIIRCIRNWRRLPPDPWGEARESLQSLATLPPDWDSYEALPMTDVAMRNAWRVMAELEAIDFLPDAIVPDSDGDVRFEWDRGGDRCWDIECCGDGDIEHISDVMPEPVLVGTRELTVLVVAIREFIEGESNG